MGGRIEKRSVDVGDHVREGQILATLDEKDLRLSMESAQAERDAAASNKDQAITEERRYGTLLSKNVVSQSEYDLKHLSAEEARARLEKADRALKLATSQLGYARLVSSNDGVVTKASAEARSTRPRRFGNISATGSPASPREVIAFSSTPGCAASKRSNSGTGIGR